MAPPTAEVVPLNLAELEDIKAKLEATKNGRNRASRDLRECGITTQEAARLRLNLRERLPPTSLYLAYPDPNHVLQQKNNFRFREDIARCVSARK